jgi:hypothetical protein
MTFIFLEICRAWKTAVDKPGLHYLLFLYRYRKSDIFPLDGYSEDHAHVLILDSPALKSDFFIIFISVCVAKKGSALVRRSSVGTLKSRRN